MNEGMVMSIDPVNTEEEYLDPAFIDEMDRQEREENARAIDELHREELEKTKPSGASRFDEDGDIAHAKPSKK